MNTDRRWLAPSIVALAMCAVAVHDGAAVAQQRPCQEDLAKLCPNVKPGSPEARKCLKDNLDKLSEPCRQRMGGKQGRRQGYSARFKGCEGDLDKFCKDRAPGGGRLINCLREHEADLSAECKTRLSGRRAGGGGGGGGGKGRGGGGQGSGRGGGGRNGAGASNTPQSSGAAAPLPTVQAK